MKRKLGIISICLLLLLVTGCGKVPKLKNGQEVVVEIKDKKFTTEDLYTELKNKYGSNILIEMVDKFIADKEVKTNDEAKEYAEAQFETLKAQIEQYEYDLDEYLSSYGFDSKEDCIEYLITAYKKDIVAKNYIKEDMITDDEINKYYDENIFGEITARHILIAPEVTDEMTDEEKKAAEEKALNEAKDIIEKINNGESFEDLAKEYSDDEGTKKDGGLFADFSKDSVVPEFWDASYKLNNGEYTKEPVKSQYGYHIILKISAKDKPELNTVKEDILDNIVSEKLINDTALTTTVWTKIREKYEMNIQDDHLKSDYNKTIK